MNNILDLRKKLRTKDEITVHCLDSLAEDIKAIREKITHPAGYFIVMLSENGDYSVALDMEQVKGIKDFEDSLEFLHDLLDDYAVSE